MNIKASKTYDELVLGDLPMPLIRVLEAYHEELNYTKDIVGVSGRVAHLLASRNSISAADDTIAGAMTRLRTKRESAPPFDLQGWAEKNAKFKIPDSTSTKCDSKLQLRVRVEEGFLASLRNDNRVRAMAGMASGE